MENLAYLHLANAYEDGTPSELISLSCLLNKATAPDWNRLSGKAWKYMLPLVLSLSILSAVSSVMALEKGDQGPSVRNLQQKLKSAGFYQAPITQVYDTSTEESVRRFQKAADIQVNGVVGATTLEKLEKWQPKKPSNTTAQAKKTTTTTQAKKTSTTTVASSATNQRHNSNYLMKGDEGQDVKVLQERLRVAGFYYGNSTGIFGPITEEAVRRFQDSYNLSVDGIVGPATSRKLPPVGVGDGEETPKKVADRDKLRLGDRGEPVRIVQEQLIQAGYLEGEPNGYYGPYTADAVKRFQSANFLSASGVAGPTTRAKLYGSINTASKSDFSVLEIQTRLRERGFYKGKLNGVMADDTKKAIKQAQEFYGISLKDLKSGRF
ncbi:peptidoglycan-binding protein [Nostoc sp. PA-18-2419]|uniref:peptidoglycan-binding domain-containing protein n=1 Tax=Nostoc sp. PA-18-2419 TaxID=2575443 RepID=UPI001109B9F7|nr:peptidoglycan-binding protein [Nostoc sp. PA-18-2419]